MTGQGMATAIREEAGPSTETLGIVSLWVSSNNTHEKDGSGRVGGNKGKGEDGLGRVRGFSVWLESGDGHALTVRKRQLGAAGAGESQALAAQRPSRHRPGSR